jgi:hypothetical protein
MVINSFFYSIFKLLREERDLFFSKVYDVSVPEVARRIKRHRNLLISIASQAFLLNDNVVLSSWFDEARKHVELLICRVLNHAEVLAIEDVWLLVP